MNVCRESYARLLLVVLLVPACTQDVGVGAEARVMRQAVSFCTDPLGCVSYETGEPIHLAFAGAFAPGVEALGVDTLRGVELALDGVDVLGFGMDITVFDSECSFEGGEAAANEIVADPTILAVIGTNCSGAAAGLVPIASNAGYAIVSPSNSAPFLTDPETRYDGYFRASWNDRDQTARLADFTWLDLGARTAAIMACPDPYCQALAEGFEEQFEALGGEVLASVAVELGQVAPTLATQIRPLDPDALILPLFFPELGRALQVGRLMLSDTDFLGTDTLRTTDLFRPQYHSEGVYVSGPDPAFDPELYPPVLAAYLDAYGEEPLSPYHAFGYDAALMVVEAIERAATLDEDGTITVGRQDLRDQLAATMDLRGLTGTLTCDAFGDCGGTSIVVLKVQNGEFVQP